SPSASCSRSWPSACAGMPTPRISRHDGKISSQKQKTKRTMKLHPPKALWLLLVLGLALPGLLSAQSETKKPNILVIFGDDVGQSNVSAYTHGLVGYKTPNIDRIAKEGLLF